MKQLLPILDKSLFKVGADPITAKSLIIGLTLLILGYYLSKIISKKITTKIKARISTKKVIESVLFYTLLLFALIFSFKFAKLPITIFTFFGGALAVGVGFGAKNLINNFISGIILLVEQPIKVGDFVEISGVFGYVENIGSRSTIIKTIGNKHYVIPNSYFLENNFLNWTMKNNIVSFDVPVGVAYGSDVEKVKSTLLKAAEQSTLILTDPKAKVLFTNFGDNALEFKLYYSLYIKNIADRATIETELRTIIAKDFAENNLIIAFPQRELNFNPNSKPIEFKMIT